MLRRTLLLTPLALLAALAAPAAPLGTAVYAQEAASAFVGSWTLDPDKSESPRDVMQRTREGTGSNFAERGRRRPGGGGSHGGGGRGGGRGGGGGAPSVEQQAVNRVMMEIGMWRAPTFEMSETDAGFQITLPGGRSQTLQTDKEERTSAQGGIEIKTKAEAKENEIKVEYKAPGNAKVVRKFKLKDDGATLLVETAITNSRMKINFKFKQVYRRTEQSA